MRQRNENCPPSWHEPQNLPSHRTHTPSFRNFLYSVAYRGGGLGCSTPPKFQSFDKAEPNFLFRGKYIRNNLKGIRVSLICKLSGTAPDHRFLCPLSSIEFVEPPPREKIPGYATACTCYVALLINLAWLSELHEILR
jgi:hypothetical protein